MADDLKSNNGDKDSKKTGEFRGPEVSAAVRKHVSEFVALGSRSGGIVMSLADLERVTDVQLSGKSIVAIF